MVKLAKPTVYNTKVKTAHGTASIVEDRYNFTNKKVYKEDLDKAVLKELKQKLKDDGPFYASMSYWTDQIYSAPFVLIESEDDLNLDMFDNDMFVDYNESDILDPETRVRMVSIFTAPGDGQSSTGKDSEHNDCLWMCLIQAFNELPPALKKPGNLKKFLGLKRDDGIDIKLIPQIERKLKMNIIVCGSHQYKGAGKYPRNLKIRLWKGHYEPKDVRGLGNENYNELRSGYDVMKKGRPYPCFYKIDLETETAKMCYLENYRDGKKIIMEKPMKYLNEFYTKHNPGRRLFLRQVPRKKTKQMVDGVEKTVYVPREPEDVIDEMIDEYTLFQRNAYQLLGPTARGSLNPFKCNGNYRSLATQFFSKVAPKSISFCEDYMLSEEDLWNEEYWLKCAMTGGLIYSKRGRVEKAYDADINSMYPWLMKKIDFITRKGKFKVIDEVPAYQKKHQYAIFRCSISGYDNRLFQKNKHGFYTGLDIKIAQDEGWDIELAQDGEPNMLWYTKFCRVPGEEVFGVFVDSLFKMKSNGVVGAKQVINVLWGYLCSRSVKEIHTWKTDTPVVEDMGLMHKMEPRFKDNGKQEYSMKKYNLHDMKNDERVLQRIFRFKYARFACFMTALGRYEMYKVLKPIKKYVRRIHTDGFITSKDVADVTVGDGLGEWKTKTGSCQVVNSNVVHWD